MAGRVVYCIVEMNLDLEVYIMRLFNRTLSIYALNRIRTRDLRPYKAFESYHLVS